MSKDFAKIFSEANNITSSSTKATSNNKVAKDYDALFKEAQNINLGTTGNFSRNYTEQLRNQKYNFDLFEGQDWNYIRASNQSGFKQAVNAGISGIGSGLLTAVEDVSYILDFDNNVNRLLGNQEVESNFVADWAKNNKEALYEALPIYRKKPGQVFDWNDSGFYWEAFRGMLDSAVGFGLAGMGAGAVVKGAGALVRLGAQAGKINKYKAYVDMFGKAVQEGRLGNASAAFITNYGEGKMMALELYESANEKALSSMISDYQSNNAGEMPDQNTLENFQLKASKLAGDQANIFQLRNMMFMVTDYLQIKSIFKGANTNTRNLLPKPSFNQWAKTQLATAPKEALEEVGQNVLQMEGEYQGEQALRDMGITVKDPITLSENFGDRFLEFATSDQALLEGMMGLFSGPIQYGITTAPFENREAKREQYNDQQAVIARNTEFFKSKTENVAKRKEEIEALVKAGQPELAAALKMQEFDALALENFTHGTTENLEAVLQEELNSDEYSQEEKKEIENKISRLTEMETEFNQYRDYANSHGVYANRLQLRQVNDTISTIENKTQTLTEKLQQDYNNLINAYNKNADADDQVSFSDVLQAIGNNDFSALPQQIKDSLMGNPEVGTILGLNKSLEKVEGNLQAIHTKYKDMTSREYQMGFEMFKNIMLDENLNTEEKIDNLNKLDSNTKQLKNKTLSNQIRIRKAKLEQELADAKAKSDTGEVTPETKAAVNAKANAKTSTTKSQIDPEKKKELTSLKSGAIFLGADGSNERAVEISKMSLEEIDKLTPEEKENLMGAYQEYVNLSAEGREELNLDASIIAELTGQTPISTNPKVTESEPITKESLEEEKARRIQEAKQRYEEAASNPSIGSLLGQIVYYNGKPYLVEMEGQMRYVLTDENTIIELNGNYSTKVKELGIELPIMKEQVGNDSKYKISSISENEVNVNGVDYIIVNDEKGNIKHLIPNNKKSQKIKNEKLLIAVEIERNKQEFNSVKEQATEEVEYNTIKENNPLLDFVEGVYGKNWNDTISNALDKLYNDQALSETERLALDLWVTDAIIELTNLYVRNSNDIYKNALDNLELINILLYTDNHAEYKQKLEEISTTDIAQERERKNPIEKIEEKESKVVKDTTKEKELNQLQEELKVIELEFQRKLKELEGNSSTKESNNEVLQAQPKNTKDDDIEVRNYFSETSTSNAETLQKEGKVENSKDAVDVKASIFGSTNLKQWLENGESKENQEVTYRVDLNNKNDGAQPALKLFKTLKPGDTIPKEVIDNLPIFFSVDSDPSVTAFIHTVRRGNNNTGADAEAALRTQIIQSLLAGNEPKGVITGQYGGDLVTTNGEQENSILSIPDFLETKPGDIPIYYVDGGGDLKDSKTREKVKGKFSTLKVMLKGKNLPMAGAIFTTVKKLNGETFPLKLNIKSLSNREQSLVMTLLSDAIKPSKGGVNYFSQTVSKSDPIWDMVDSNDIQYLTNSNNFKGGITFGQLLNFYVYEGSRSITNPLTQLFVKNGVIHFGDQVMNESNKLTQLQELKEFLSIYKNRNVDLRQFSTSPAYRNHILESGVLVTDAQVDRPTLFKTTDQKEMDEQYGQNKKDKAANRFKTGTVYLKPEVSNPVSKPETKSNTDTKAVEQIEAARKVELERKTGESTQPSTSVKQGVQEIFENNPTLANSVYEAMGFEQGDNLPTSNETINIYAGSNQNTELSNFAIRPFTTNVETPSGEKQYTFQSVEQGFHFYKALVANNAQIAKRILATTNGGQLRTLTNRSNLKMTSEQVKEWDDTSKSIMLNLMYDSYEQNPKSAEKLLATGNAKITHTQDNTRWKTDFPEVVMTVRDMLKEEGFTTTQITQQQKQEAQSKFQEYVDATGKQDIQGFKEFVNQPSTSVKQGVSKLFESNQELANSVYEVMGINTINESDITYTDENGNPCAKMGLTNATKGTGWKIVKDFKGMPKHSQGGVDISISNKGVSMRRGGKDIKAAHGLIIPNNN